MRALASAVCVNLWLQADVAGGVDARVGRLQAVVDGHAGAGVEADADALQAEVLHVRRAARADEDFVNRDVLRPAFGHGMEQLSRRRALDALRPRC